MGTLEDVVVLPTLWVGAGCLSFTLSVAIIVIIATSEKLQMVLGPVLWLSVCESVFMCKWVVSGVAALLYKPTASLVANATNRSAAVATPVATTFVKFADVDHAVVVHGNYDDGILDEPEQREMMEGMGPELCIFQTLAGQFGRLGTVLWTVGILVNSWCLIKGFHHSIRRKIFVTLHVVIWSACFITAVVPVASDSYHMIHNGSCWVKEVWMQAFFFLAPTAIAIAAMVALTVLAIYRTQQLPANASNKRALILRSFLAFVVITIVIWGIPVISHVLRWMDPDLIFSPEWIRAEDTIVCLQGTLNFIVLMSIPEARLHVRSWKCCFKALSPRKAGSRGSLLHEMRDMVSDPALAEFEGNV